MIDEVLARVFRGARQVGGAALIERLIGARDLS